MVLHFSGNSPKNYSFFQVFKEDLALRVALVYDTRYNTTVHNSCIYKLYLSLRIIIHACIKDLSLHTVYIPKYSMKQISQKTMLKLSLSLFLVD